MTASLSTIRFGSLEPPTSVFQLTAGPLCVEFVQGVARRLRWHGVEVLRGIDCLFRDESWGTCSSQVTGEKVTATDERFEVVQDRSIADGALTCRLVFTGRCDGFLCASAEWTAHRNFLTHRAGFVLLHPLNGLSGSALRVWHEDGGITLTTFPELISPGQIAFEIAGLSYNHEGMGTNIRFEGELFEMEDQRNWGDASFKTYCRPLAYPSPYLLPAGETIRQEVSVYLTGMPSQSAMRPKSPRPAEVVPAASTERVPDVAVAIDAASIPLSSEISVVRSLSPRVARLRLESDALQPVLASVSELFGHKKGEVELEIVISKEQGFDKYLTEIAQSCVRASLPVTRVMALPEAYLRSHQPQGPWPAGPTPRDACIASRKGFPYAQIGTGVLTNFAEFNRCRPDTSICDYVSHSGTALVHAADDASVIESLEGLRHVLASGRALAGDRAYRLGLISIGMQSNPYGAGVAANPEQRRIPMARVDPRQRGLFAAAWAVGVMAATQGHGLASIALAAPVGPFGVVYRKASWPQPIYDDRQDAVVYPLFHVIRALIQIGNLPRLVPQLPEGLVGVAATRAAGHQLIVANLSQETCELSLPEVSVVRQLDALSFAKAITDPDWLVTSAAEEIRRLTIEPFAVAFIDSPRGGR